MRFFLARVFLLAGILAALDLWVARHTGYGLQDPRVIGTLGAAIVMGLWVLEKVISTLDENRLKRYYRAVAGFALDGRVLAALFAATAFFMLNLSSIVVLKEGVSAAAAPGVEPVGETGRVEESLCERGSGPWRYCVWTGPFGSSYRVSVEGYLPRLLEVYPLAGARIAPETDLERSPTVLIRPTTKGLDSLSRCEEASEEDDKERCGEFTLCRIEDGKCVATIVQQEKHAGSFLIGWPQAMPRGLTQDWRLELIASDVDEERASKIFAKTLVQWKRHRTYMPGRSHGTSRIPPLVPGTRLRATVSSKSKTRELVDCKVFTVEAIAFMDVAMESTLDSGACPP